MRKLKDAETDTANKQLQLEKANIKRDKVVTVLFMSFFITMMGLSPFKFLNRCFEIFCYTVYDLIRSSLNWLNICSASKLLFPLCIVSEAIKVIIAILAGLTYILCVVVTVVVILLGLYLFTNSTWKWSYNLGFTVNKPSKLIFC
jgi:uncharacterized membrane protein